MTILDVDGGLLLVAVVVFVGVVVATAVARFGRSDIGNSGITKDVLGEKLTDDSADLLLGDRGEEEEWTLGGVPTTNRRLLTAFFLFTADFFFFDVGLVCAGCFFGGDPRITMVDGLFFGDGLFFRFVVFRLLRVSSASGGNDGVGGGGRFLSVSKLKSLCRSKGAGECLDLRAGGGVRLAVTGDGDLDMALGVVGNAVGDIPSNPPPPPPPPPPYSPPLPKLPREGGDGDPLFDPPPPLEPGGEAPPDGDGGGGGGGDGGEGRGEGVDDTLWSCGDFFRRLATLGDSSSIILPAYSLKYASSTPFRFAIRSLAIPTCSGVEFWFWMMCLSRVFHLINCVKLALFSSSVLPGYAGRSRKVLIGPPSPRLFVRILLLSSFCLYLSKSTPCNSRSFARSAE